MFLEYPTRATINRRRARKDRDGITGSRQGSNIYGRRQGQDDGCFGAREDVEELIAIKPTTTELVLTGRGLLPLADLADLVTEMRPVKHYFDEGLLARQGIEY